MQGFSSAPFDLVAEFGGFVFTEEGKRRLKLRIGENERLFKVPRLLRRRMIGNYHPGQTIRVAGIEEHDKLSGRRKWIVSAVLPPDARPGTPVPPFSPVPVTVRVCAKKNCWRQGGCELFAALQHGITARGLADQMRLRAVGCLDRCKQAPNVDCGDTELSWCSPRDADAILTRISTGQEIRA